VTGQVATLPKSRHIATLQNIAELPVGMLFCGCESEIVNIEPLAIDGRQSPKKLGGFSPNS
jgi:hypothetical protein